MTRRLHALLNGSDNPDHPLTDPAGPFDCWIGDLDLELLLCELQSHPADALRRISLALNETTGNMVPGDPQNASRVESHHPLEYGLDSARQMIEILRRPPKESPPDPSAASVAAPHGSTRGAAAKSDSKREYDWDSDDGPPPM